MAEPGPPPRGPLQGLVDLAQELQRPGQMPTFVRGLVFGAFVGAAIAGSALLRRRAKGDGAATGNPGRVEREGPQAR